MESKAAAIDGTRPAGTTRHGGTSAWARFVDVNKRFCRTRLQPRLYPVSHMTALRCWYSRRIKGGPHASLLEFGCGREMPVTHIVGDRFRVRCATDLEEVPSADIPDGVLFKACTPDSIPFGDAQFDAVAIRSVMEHVEDPPRTFAELARVVKPGGQVFMNLPSKWDYVSVVARCAGRFKSSILKTVVRTQWEDFPVHYRCNTRRAVYRFANDAGFDVVEFVPLPSQPSYLSFFVPLYLAGAIYQFLVSILALDVLQPSFMVILRKRPDASHGERLPR